MGETDAWQQTGMMDIVEPDWLEMERQTIDALGPKFEALVDTLMSEMGCAPEKRDEVRRSLYYRSAYFRISSRDVP